MLDLRHSRMTLNYRKNIDRIDSLKNLSFFSVENMPAVLKGNYTSVHPNPAMISSNKTNTAVHFLLALETKANGNVATPQSIPEVLQGVHNIKEGFVAIYGGRDFYDSLFKPVINTLSDLSDLQYFRNPILKNKIYWFVEQVASFLEEWGVTQNCPSSTGLDGTQLLKSFEARVSFDPKTLFTKGFLKFFIVITPLSQFSINQIRRRQPKTQAPRATP